MKATIRKNIFPFWLSFSAIGIVIIAKTAGWFFDAPVLSGLGPDSDKVCMSAPVDLWTQKRPRYTQRPFPF